MADVTPDYHLEIQRLRVQSLSLQHNIGRYRLEILQARSTEKKAFENMSATKKALEETQKNIDEMVQVHGLPDEVDDDG